MSGPSSGPVGILTAKPYSGLFPSAPNSGNASPDVGGPGCDEPPWGIHADSPYEYDGLALSSGDIICLINYQVLTISQDLQRSRWYGTQSLDEQGATVANNDYVGVAPYWDCLGAGTYTYYDPTTGAAELDGTWYDGTAYNAARFNC